MPGLLRALEANHDNFVAITILKFVAEFVANKQQRLNFDVSSPNGILMFRDTSRVLHTYGRFIIGRNVGDTRKYEDKFKGISVCLSIMRLSIAGRYVPFGVFDLYQDRALDTAVDVVCRMMLDVPLDDILAFPKLTNAFFAFLDTFTTELIFSLKSLPDGTFLYMMRACIDGLRSLQANTSSEAALTLDHVVTFLFTSTNVPPARRVKPMEPHLIVRCAEQYSEILPLIMAQILQLLVLDETSNQWSLSRPLLGLILLCKTAFVDFTRKFISVQYAERQEILSKAITQLMEGIEDNLSMKNRDKFTQAVMTLRRAVEKEKFVEVALPMPTTR
ncbi:Exportin 7 [Gonapodya sp. JEL0774]|nr:Exportin 7 [Gonapodya sp. JEL0774]